MVKAVHVLMRALPWDADNAQISAVKLVDGISELAIANQQLAKFNYQQLPQQRVRRKWKKTVNFFPSPMDDSLRDEMFYF